MGTANRCYQTLRTAGAALSLALSLGSLAAPAPAAASAPPPINKEYLTLPPSCQPAHGQSVYCYYDYHNRWGYLCVDFKKYDPYTDGYLIEVVRYVRVKQYDPHYGWYYTWDDDYGSGSAYYVGKNDVLLTFTIDTGSNESGYQFFECRPYNWGTKHDVVTHPYDYLQPEWFYLEPYYGDYGWWSP